jgi:hypothetical protein
VVLQPVTPTVVRVVEAPSRETGVGDILLGAVGLVGFVLIAAALTGLVAGAVFVLVRRWRYRPDAHRDTQLNLSSLDG